MIKEILRCSWMFHDYWLTCMRHIIFDNKNIVSLDYEYIERISEEDKKALRLEKLYKEGGNK